MKRFIFILLILLCLPSKVFATDGDYESHWDISAKSGTPHGLTNDGTYLYVLDKDDDAVYKYTTAGVYQATYDLSSSTTYPQDIAYYDGYFYVNDITDDVIYKYNTSFVLQSFTCDLDAVDANNTRALATDGTYLYVGDYFDDDVYIFNMDGSFSSQVDVSSQSTNIIGIACADDYIYVLDGTTDDVYKYNSSMTYQSVTWNTGNGSSGCGSPTAIEIFGDHFYVSDSIDDEIYLFEYTSPSTPTSRRRIIISQ